MLFRDNLLTSIEEKHQQIMK